MEKFKGKYRIESARMQNWDYGWNASYFVTICTQNREHYFGEIENNEMILSEIGKMADKYWYEIPEQFPFVKLDEFVVMPNHIHGIVVIDKQDDKRDGGDCCEHGRDAINRVSTGTKTINIGGFSGIKNPMITENLSKIIRWYKGRVTFESRKIHADFAWQSRFHDHIVRDDISYQRIKNYIINNPKKWDEDKFNGN
ncbi:transposase [Saccharicrinis sp. 156]|uniref:transposase n=1 Tax=Saccharicrinis sp. 156 TaxID=3417574 RepID=UPI003D352A8D